MRRCLFTDVFDLHSTHSGPLTDEAEVQERVVVQDAEVVQELQHVLRALQIQVALYGCIADQRVRSAIELNL